MSMGAFEKGPMAPDMSPMTMCWYEGKSFKSGWYACANFLSSWYAVKFAPMSTLCISLVSKKRVHQTDPDWWPAAKQ